MFPLLMLLAVSIHTDFEGGNLGRVETVGPDHYACHVNGETDQEGRNRQASWYYFRVDGAKGRRLTLDMVDLAGEYNYRPTRGAVTKDTLPFFSEDQKTWRVVDSAEFDENGPMLRLHLKPGADHVWIAHTPPYTSSDLARLLDELGKSPFVRKTSVGKSAGGRDIPLLTMTDPSAPDDHKKVIWLLFRQHAWESGSSWSGEGLIRYLVSNDATAAKIRRESIVKAFPMCDPDGVARGGVRFNANHFDLNRNWDTVDAAKMPEIAAERKAILDWVDAGHPVDLVLTLHNTETSEYLEGPPDATGATKPLMERIFRNLSAGTTFAASRPPSLSETTTTAGKPGRMSAPQGIYHDRRIPSFLIETRIARHPKLGRQPTVEDRERFGVELIQALWQAVERRAAPASSRQRLHEFEFVAGRGARGGGGAGRKFEYGVGAPAEADAAAHHVRTDLYDLLFAIQVQNVDWELHEERVDALGRRDPEAVARGQGIVFQQPAVAGFGGDGLFRRVGQHASVGPVPHDHVRRCSSRTGEDFRL